MTISSDCKVFGKTKDCIVRITKDSPGDEEEAGF